MQQIKERGALPMIDRGDIRQAIDRWVAYLGFTAGRWLYQFEHKAGQPYQNSKKRRNGQRDYEGAESPRLSPLWLSASSSACHGLLIITVITPLPTKPSATNARELKLANAALPDMQMRQRDVAAPDVARLKS